MTTLESPFLSICIPCRERWPEVVGFLREARVQDIPAGIIETCVSLSAVEEIPHDLLDFEPFGVRTLLSGSVVTFVDNLCSSLLMAQGEWCLIMGDDDRIGAGGLENLIEELRRIPPEVGFAALHVFGTPRKRAIARRSVGMRCGTMSGLLFRRIGLVERLQQAKYEYSGTIYPQIWMGISSCDRKSYPLVGVDVTIGGPPPDPEVMFIGRPPDFGIGERLFWSMKGNRESLLSRVERNMLILNVFMWSKTIERFLVRSGDVGRASEFRGHVRRAGERHCGRRHAMLFSTGATLFLWGQRIVKRGQEPQRD